MIIIANGMLRSGSTLQYNIAAMLMEARGPLHRAGFMGGFSKPETRAKLNEMKASRGWAILKTHEAPLSHDFYDDRVRVLFSYRDVRDIAASIRKKWGHSFETILSEIDAMLAIEAAFSEIPGVLVQPYELLYRDIPTATRQIAAHLGVNVEAAEACAIADRLCVDKLMRHPRQPGSLFRRLASRIMKRGFDGKTLLHTDHISATAGAKGDWANQFADAEIARLEAHYWGWLTTHGYPEGPRPAS